MNTTDFYILEQTNDLESQYKHNIKTLQVIRNALKNDHVHCFYQPIYNNMTHKIDKYEVLMRISDEDDVLYQPYAFLEIAKSSKYYHRLTRAMIEQSFEFFSGYIQVVSATVLISQNTSLGVLNPKHFLGRLLSLSTTQSISS